MKNGTSDFTEQDAATAYAKAWNNLDPIEFVELLAEDAHYASQYVFDEIEGKEAFTEYLAGKFKTVRNSESEVSADLAVIQKPYPGKPCTILVQGYNTSVVTFEVSNGKINRFDLCMPELFDVQMAGDCPK